MVIALYISFIAIIAMGLLVLSTKNKNQMHWALLANILCMSFWTLGLILENIWIIYYKHSSMAFAYIVYLSLTFFPVSLWFIGMVFKNAKVELSRKYILVLIVPIISNIVLWTNRYTHLFYTTFYNLRNANDSYGVYFYFMHAPYSYVLMLLWIINMTVYAIKNGGILVKQVTFAMVGTICLLLTNILFTLKIISSAYWNPIAYSFMLLCYLIAMFRYGFLNVIPIAKEKIIDSIRDCFIILNKNLEVQDFNKPFLQTFNNLLIVKTGDNFTNILRQYKFIKISPEYLKEAIEKSMYSEPLLPLEVHIVEGDFNKWFSITITCIDSDKDIGSIITFRDITREKQYEVIAMERTKLRGFVQIAGDMAHDINTPLSLARNCSGSIDDILNGSDCTLEKIGQELDYLKYKSRTTLNSCERSLKIANKLKEQTMNIFNEDRKEFDLKELITDVIRKEPEIEFFIRQLSCSCSIEGDANIKIHGYPKNLSRVIKNLIKNAMESYKSDHTDTKSVKIIIKRDDEIATIAVKDHGIGIQEDLQKDIFIRPLKIKNLKPDGGGVSLFFAPLIVVGQLEGKIWFESVEGKGSTFFISIPIVCNKRNKEDLL